MRSKARLTITLARDLLTQIDRMIDHRKIRNRSHAIELLLRESLKSRVTTAVILAGGITDEDPIPALQPIGNQPLIFITLRHLIESGIQTIHILAGRNEPSVRQLLAEGNFLGAQICYGGEEKPLGTAGAVKSIEAKLDPEPFLVLHSDILTDINLAEFIQFHKNENCLATIAVKPRDAERKYGKLLLQGNKITDFSETDQSEGISIVNTGVYLLQPEALSLIVAGQPAYFERDVFPNLAAIGELSAFFFQGVWFDISAPDSYQLAQERWTTG
jgi:NDP-sugar pyrophosphorylase family protein